MAEQGMGGTDNRQDDSQNIKPASMAGGPTETGSGMGLGGKLAGVGAAAGMMAARGGRGLGRAAGNVGRAVGARMVSWGAGLSGVTGGLIGPTAGTAVASGGSLVTVALASSLAVGGISDLTANRDGAILDCGDLAAQNSVDSRSTGGSATGDHSAEQLETTKDIYSALSYAGMSDENIAGILGNFQTESGIDYTSIEGIMDEPYDIGPQKQAVIDAGYEPQPKGIGLGQWSFERTHALVKFAEEKGTDWYSGVEVQLAYAMSDDSGAPVFNEMVANENEGHDDPVGAANYFLNNWERPADPVQPQRGEQAGEWYAQMGGWDVDKEIGQSVLDMAETSKKSANNDAVQQELADCVEKSGSAGGGNEDIATAAATLAWAYTEWGKGPGQCPNNGTDVYQYVHDEVLEGDPLYCSCDRVATTAIRWAGADDTFPFAGTAAEYAYAEGEGQSKWEKLNTDGYKEEDLEPGDVLIVTGGGENGHILIYVGEDALKDVFGDDYEEDGKMVQGSLSDSTAVVSSWSAHMGDGRSYSVYRSKGPDKDSEYAKVKVPSGMKGGAEKP